MTIGMRSALLVALFCAIYTQGCGGKSPPPNSPEQPPAEEASGSASAESEQPSKGDAPETAEKPSKAEAPSKSTAPDTAPAKQSTAKSSRSPREVLELKDTIFFLSSKESEVKKEAETACSKSAAHKAKKKAACVEKEERDIEGEGLRFEQDKGGKLWWLVVHRKGNNIVTVHKIRFAYGPQTDTSIVIKPHGKDMGPKPWKKPPAEVKFEVPTEYRIVRHEPNHAKLVYDAKGGIGGGR